MQNGIEPILKQHNLIPVVTISHINEVEPLVEYLVGRGVNCMEVTLRTKAAIKAVEVAKKIDRPEFSVGVGTVKTKSDIDAAKAAGADFLVSPGFTPRLIEEMHSSELPFLPGAVTPGELLIGMELDVRVFKFFPAGHFGGLDTLKTYGGVFPELKFCPTGGITNQSAPEYLALPNVLAVGGSWFQREQQRQR